MFPTSPSARVRAALVRSGHDGPEALGRPLEREILRKVLAMGLPSVASFLMLTVYDLIDVFWLAKLGEEPVAAVTVFGALLWVLTFANQIIGTGSVAVISRRFGENDQDGTRRAIKSTFLGKFAVGIVMGGVGILILPEALAFLGATPAVRDLGVSYGRIQCAGLGVSLASFSVYTALRGIGRPALGMWISLIGTVVNMALDPMLIFGIGPFPRLGITGASVASMAGFTAVTVCGFLALAGRWSPVRVRWLHAPHARVDESVRMMRIGLPSGLSSLSFAAASSMVVKLVSGYGTTVVALFGMSNKVLHFGIMVMVGLGLGTSALIGQYLGSREPNKAWLAAALNMCMAATAMLIFALMIAAFAPRIVGLFFADPALAAPGASVLRLLAIGLPFIGLSIGSEQAYAGAGRNTPPMVMHFVVSWGFVIPLMLLLGRTLDLGPNGMMLGNSLGQILGSVIGVALVRHGSWLEHEV